MTDLVLVGIGGVVGAWARHLLGEWIDIPRRDTLVVNLVGSFLFGVVLALFSETDLTFLVVGVGFCGAFTTFSTHAFETVRLLETGDVKPAVIYFTLTLVGSVVAVLGGLFLAGLFI